MTSHPAYIQVRAHRKVDSYVAAITSLVDAALTSLKATGARGVFTLLRETHAHLVDFHANLDLADVSIDDDFLTEHNIAVLSRKLNVVSSN